MIRLLALFCLLLSPISGQAGETIARIKQDGVVRCGTKLTPAAYVYTEDKEMKGIDVEFCSAVATAITGRPESYKLVNAPEGIKALFDGKIDVMLGGTPWTPLREFASDATMPAPLYHTGFAFIGKYKPDASSMREYAGSRVCVESRPFAVKSLEDYNRKFSLNFRIMTLPTLVRAKELLYLGRCDLLFDSLEIIHSDYFKKAPADIDLVVLPEIVRTYATGPIVLERDVEFRKTIARLIQGLVKAEEKGVSSQNIEDFQNTEDPEIRSLLNEDKNSALKNGLDAKWLYRTIAEKGNYGEMFERGLGEKSMLKLKRSMNRLSRKGGKISAPSFEE